MNRYRAVTFDFGNTLAPGGGVVPVCDRIRQAWNEVLGTPATRLPQDDELKALNERCSAAAGGTPEPGWADQYVTYYNAWARHLLTEFNVISASDHAPRFAETFRDVSDRLRVLYDDTRQMLEDLRAMGFRMSIVSNNDGTLARRVKYLKIDGFFEVVADSAHVRSNKPDAGIFLQTLDTMKLKPSEVLHVGDLYDNDVKAAGVLGIDSVWINRRNEEAPSSKIKPRFVIRQLAELPALLR